MTSADPERIDASVRPLPAVVIHDLEAVLLLEEHPNESTPAAPRMSWTADFRTRMSRSAWHVLWPLAALATFVLLSWSVHRMAILGDRG